MASDARLIQAVKSAARKLSSSGNFNELIRDVLAICLEAVGAKAGTIYLHDEDAKRLRFQHVLPASSAASLPVRDIAEDFGMAGQAFQSRQTLLREIDEKPEEQWNEFERHTQMQVRSMVAVPLMIEDEAPIGVVQLINKNKGAFTESDAAVLEIVSSVATMAYINFRLKEESTRASTLLGMGKVGHDIGNLAATLYANLSYSDLALEAMKRDEVKGKNTISTCLTTLEPMIQDLRSSVDRIVGYSQLISDMSAGRPLRPNKAMGCLGPVIEASARYLETDARASHIGFVYQMEENTPETSFDNLYVFRIVQNLVGNAIKAVRDAMPEEWIDEHLDDDEALFGEIAVTYRFENGNHVIEVEDCGPGMNQLQINRILSGNATSQWDKAGGSGWGTKIVLELTATHGGTVSIESEVGQGSTFRVVIPQEPA